MFWWLLAVTLSSMRLYNVKANFQRCFFFFNNILILSFNALDSKRLIFLKKCIGICIVLKYKMKKKILL